MTEKLISAIDVLKYTVLAGEIRNQYMEVVPAYFVREAPSVEAEPVRHRSWVIKTHDDGYGEYQIKHCPDCDRGLPVEYDADYCPKCGAKMDGDPE